MGSLPDQVLEADAPERRRGRARQRAGNRSGGGGVVALVAALAALLLGELVVRVVLPPPGFQAVPDDLPGLWRPDPALGFVYASDFAGTISRAYYTIEITTNELGMRERPLGHRRASNTVLAVGDSFTAGWGVRRDEAWPAVLEAELRARGHDVDVLNGGVSAYNLRQVRGRALTLADELLPDVVVAGVYQDGWGRLFNPYVLVDQNVVPRNVADRVLPVEGGYLVTAMHRPWMQELDFWLSARAHLPGHAFRAAYSVWEGVAGSRAPAPQSEPAAAWEDTLADTVVMELSLLRDELATRGIGLVVLLINEQDPDGSFAPRQTARNEVVATAGGALGFKVHDPLDDLVEAAGGRPVLRFGGDAHWTGMGHRVAARSLARVFPDPKGAPAAAPAASGAF